MNQAQIEIGDAVRITAGPYKDAEGVVEDRLPECDAVRVHTKEGSAYGFLENLMRLPIPARTPPKQIKQRNPLQK